MTVHDIFYFRAYQDLAKNDKALGLTCNSIKDHGLLIPNIHGDNDELYLYCLECDFKLNPGIVTIDLIKSIVKESIVNE